MWRGFVVSWKRPTVSGGRAQSPSPPSFTVAKVRSCWGEDVTSRKNLRGQRVGGPRLDRSSPPTPFREG